MVSFFSDSRLCKRRCGYGFYSTHGQKMHVFFLISSGANEMKQFYKLNDNIEAGILVLFVCLCLAIHDERIRRKDEGKNTGLAVYALQKKVLFVIVFGVMPVFCLKCRRFLVVSVCLDGGAYKIIHIMHHLQHLFFSLHFFRNKIRTAWVKRCHREKSSHFFVEMDRISRAYRNIVFVFCNFSSLKSGGLFPDDMLWMLLVTIQICLCEISKSTKDHS